MKKHKTHAKNRGQKIEEICTGDVATNASHIYTAGVSRKFFPPKKTMLTVHLRAPTLTNQHKESAQTNQDKESTLTNPDKEITRNQQKQP